MCRGLEFDFAVGDNAGSEAYPLWPGRPVTAHWCSENPAAVEGTDEENRNASFVTIVRLDQRISQFVRLPVTELGGVSLQAKLREIGELCPKGE